MQTYSPAVAIVALALLGAPLRSQTASEAAAAPIPAEETFYRAFFVEHGLNQPEQALGLYTTFLEAAPTNRFAGRAARLSIRILRDARRVDEANELAAKHAEVLAETVPAGINATFLDADADVAQLVGRFESESREVFANRHEIAALVGAQPGQVVADIGAGTGFFANLFARAVGEDGGVYAVEIGPRLVEHLQQLKKEMGLPQLEVVACTSRSTELSQQSTDIAFVCDTYHHFEYPRDTVASIHRALRPGGQLIVIDFERVPGESNDWVLEHVRAGKEIFQSEIEAAGFRLVRQEKAPYLKENYILRFEKQ